MGRRRSSTSLTSHVYDEVRADIVGGRLEPDSPLRLAALAGRFDVSMSVVRESLIRLTEQNLVVAHPNQGFRVAAISRDDLVDLTGMRILLETTALTRSIDRGDVDWEGAVVSAHHVLERAPISDGAHPGTTSAWADAHARFHDTLGSACGSPRLMQYVSSLRDGAEIYRQLLDGPIRETGRDIAGEHRELMELALARDAEGAAAALRQHLQRTTDGLLEHVLTD